ncbi:hypothetical protein JHK86_014790 [Glycine max]|nr:hypothetical protein JHK86_014790 [Glycine max]
MWRLHGNQMSYQDEFPDNHFMSCIGSVTGFQDGDVEVTWATGFTTKVAPYEIFRIEKHEGSTVTPTPYETNVEELTHEMIEHRSLPSCDKKGKHFLNEFSNRKHLRHRNGEKPGAVSSVPTFEKENRYGYPDKKDSETCDLFNCFA